MEVRGGGPSGSGTGAGDDAGDAEGFSESLRTFGLNCRGDDLGALEGFECDAINDAGERFPMGAKGFPGVARWTPLSP